MASIIGSRIVRNGLTLHLDAAQRTSYSGSGTAWNDLSGNRNNGTLTNGPTFSSINGGSIVFDGINDYVNVTHASSPITNLSYEIMCRIDSIPASSTFRLIWQKSSDWNDPTGISLQMIYGMLRFSYGASWIGSVTVDLSLLTAGNWHHIVGTVPSTSAGTTARLYLNGVQVATGTNTSTPITTSPLTIGAGSGPYFLGLISMFRCYNRELTAAEISQNFNALRGRYEL